MTRASHSSDPAAHRAPRRILLVEDHEDTAGSIALLLRANGHQVDVCPSVAAALERLVHKTYDAILCDLALPDGTGIALISGIRAFCRTPAIAMTGYGEPEDVARCLQSGFDRHLAKPVKFDLLEATLSELTGPAGAPEDTGPRIAR